jgi:hypothetical protein
MVTYEDKGRRQLLGSRSATPSTQATIAV